MGCRKKALRFSARLQSGQGFRDQGFNLRAEGAGFWASGLDFGLMVEVFELKSKARIGLDCLMCHIRSIVEPS